MSLTVDIEYHDGVISNINTTLKRPGEAIGQWLAKQNDAAALKALPTIFSVCGRSHEVAAKLALKQLTDLDEAREQTFHAVLESLREYMIRLIQHWNFPLSRTRLGQWMQALYADEKSTAVLASEALNLLPDQRSISQWLTDLQHCWQQKFAGVKLAETSSFAEWSPQVNTSNDNYIAGCGAQVFSPLIKPAAAQFFTTQLQQVVADMLADFRHLAGRITGDATGFSLIQQREYNDPEGHHSEGWIRTSRGWLCHRISETDNDRHWRVMAPTDINYGENHTLLNELLNSVAISEDKLTGLVTALVQAIDPCVEFSVSVNGKNHA